MKVLGLVPVHLESKRFPGKAMELLDGVSLFEHAYNALDKSKEISELVVVTDSMEVGSYCDVRDMPSYYDNSCQYLNGTERCAGYLGNKISEGTTHVVNVQCDEPDITGDDIDRLILCFKEGHSVVTLAGQSEVPPIKFNEPAVGIADGNVASIFTRRESQAVGNMYIHIGVYGYTVGALIDYLNHGPCVQEELQSLEQLRWEAMHRQIFVAHVDGERRSVNVPEDLERINNGGI